MKKILMILVLASLFTSGLFAASNTVLVNQKNEEKWTDLSYVNVPVLKVYEGREGYFVIYQKNKYGVGNTVLPKKWTQGNKENPSKLKFRHVRSGADAYMTIQKKDGNFRRVVLNVPYSKMDGLWGLMDYHKTMSGVDKDTLEELEF